MGGISILLGGHSLLDRASKRILPGVILGCLAGITILVALLLEECFWAKMVRMLQPILSRLERYDVGQRLNYARTSMVRLLRSPGAVIKVFYLSFVYQSASAIFLYLVLRSLNADIGLLSLVPVLTLTTVVLMLPISIQGIGVREGLYVYFLGQMGVSNATVLSGLLVPYSAWLMSGLVGGCLFALRNFSKDEAEKPGFCERQNLSAEDLTELETRE